jgi:ferredoxin/tetratricopeptide (TPR) repeat protein
VAAELRERGRGSAALPREVEHRAGCGPVPGVAAQPRSRRGRWRALVLLGVHLAIAARIAHWKHAGTALTPLEPSEAAVALANRVIDAGLLFFLLTILTTLVVGRFFCGWACHLVALQDGAAWLLGRLGLRPRLIRSRALALVPFWCAAVMFLWPLWERWTSGAPAGRWRIELTTSDYWGRFPGLGVALVTFAVCGFALVWLLGSKGFCTYACPYGALFGLADRVAPGRIRVDADLCEGCGHCTAVCTSNVLVHREVALFGQVVDPGCMKCLDCVSACPKEALSFGFGARPPAPAPAKKRQRPEYDFSAREEWALGLVFLAAFLGWFKSHDLVPLLLATALAVGVAVAAVLLGRLLRWPEVRLQRATLRTGGRLTPHGWLALGSCVLFLALTVHSGLVNLWEWRARRALAELVAADPAARTAELTEARSALERVQRWGLLPRRGLANQLGQVQAELGQWAEAERSLRRAIAEDSQALAPRAKLVEVLERSERWPQLAIELSALFALAPPSADQARGLAARGVLEQLVLAAPEALEPRLVVIESLLAVGDLATARENLDRARERWPGDARLGALAARLP